MENETDTFDEAKHQEEIKARDKKEKRMEWIIGAIIYGGFGLWALFSFLDSDKLTQQIMMLFGLVGVCYYDLCKRIEAAKARIEERIDWLEYKLRD